jgi:hypothetical protein
MGKGGVLQLSAKGLQDSFLTKNPTLNHFQSIYKQHVPFATEQQSLFFSGDVNFGRKITCNISRTGDLLSNIYLNLKLPPLVKTSGTFAGWTNSVGNAIIEYVELEIGGRIIDKQYGLYMEIIDELIDSKIENILLGKYDTNLVLGDSAISNTEYYIPLRFWFHDDLSKSIPLISLNNHEIKVHIKLRSFDDLIHYDGPTPPNTVSISDAHLSAKYIFLDDSERRKYIDSKHLFLIKQLQINPVLSINAGTKHFKNRLELNHPCSELLWVFTELESEQNNDWFNYSKRVPNGDLVTSLMTNCKLTVDGGEIFNQNELFFRNVQHNMHHTNISNKHLYTYSFSHKPEDPQPSGSLNFSKINDANLYFDFIDSVPDMKLYVFAVNYNWLIIDKGMAGIAFNS